MGPVVIRQLAHQGWVQPVRYEDCPPLQPYQTSKRGTPSMGGLLVLASAIASAALVGGFADDHGWLVLWAALGVGAIGLIDDLRKLRQPNARGLRCRPKLVATLLVGGLIGVWLMRVSGSAPHVIIPWSGHTLELGWGAVPLAMVVIAGCAHAVNLTDGMDGLATGCLAIAFGALGWWISTRAASTTLMIWCASLAGACLGFLWFNSFPAAIFLGDVGALGLGAALGALALASGFALGLVILGGVFVIEAMSVMIQVGSYRFRQKRRVFRVAPLHHHLQLGGASEQTVVVRFWILGVLLAALGLTAFQRS